VDSGGGRGFHNSAPHPGREYARVFARNLEAGTSIHRHEKLSD